MDADLKRDLLQFLADEAESRQGIGDDLGEYAMLPKRLGERLAAVDVPSPSPPAARKGQPTAEEVTEIGKRILDGLIRDKAVDGRDVPSLVIITKIARIVAGGSFPNPTEKFGQEQSATGEQNEPGLPRRFRHRERGTTYKLIHHARLQLPGNLDGEPCVIYQSEQDNHIWVRPQSEFFDGRFEELAP